MINILQEALTGLIDGLISGTIAFFIVLMLAFFIGSLHAQNLTIHDKGVKK